MNPLVDRITAVLGVHWLTDYARDAAPGYDCECGADFSGLDDFNAHVAEQVAALFTEETQFVPVARDNSRWAARSREEAYSIPNEPAFDVSDSWIVDHIEVEHRWVSDWTAEQETP